MLRKMFGLGFPCANKKKLAIHSKTILLYHVHMTVLSTEGIFNEIFNKSLKTLLYPILLYMTF